MRPRPLLPLAIVAAALLVPTLASAEETMKPITIVGRPAKLSVVIEIRRETPNIGLRPLVPPKSFMGNK
jgi:hypothetical protein